MDDRYRGWESPTALVLRAAGFSQTIFGGSAARMLRREAQRGGVPVAEASKGRELRLGPDADGGGGSPPEARADARGGGAIRSARRQIGPLMGWGQRDVSTCTS